ncbi:Uncharacterised protein [Mycobacteroides abscessus subsp. abscessus]|nr:Uncharacterised protein [Mycobacteroides abscessus subsp. abscessus]
MWQCADHLHGGIYHGIGKPGQTDRSTQHHPDHTAQQQTFGGTNSRDPQRLG